MRCKPDSCSGCSLHDHGTDFSAVEGTGSSGVMLVGEASGANEQREQLPFRPYAPAGAVLQRCLTRMGLDRKQFSITNVIRCRPRRDFLENAPWEYSAISQCRSNLDEAIRSRRPRIIVALGGVAARELTGEAGEARGVTHLAGYVLPEQRSRIPVIVDFHPSFLRRGKASHQGVFSRVILRAVNIAKGADREWIWGVDPGQQCTWNGLQYWTKPTLDQILSVRNYLRDNPAIVLAKDLETSESHSLDEDARDGFSDTQVRLFQLSYQPGTGIAIPYEEAFIPLIWDLIHLPNKYYGHNWDNFDHKVLRAAAAREGRAYHPSRCYDTLDMFHHWQPDLPAHLQFASSFVNFPFPWKHLAATDIEFYGICDVDSDLRLGVFLEAALKRDGIWGRGEEYDLTLGYTGQVREVRPVLAAMEDRGMPIDDAERIALGAEFDIAQAKLGVEIAALASAECQRVHPKEGYKGVPPEVKKSDAVLWGGAVAPFKMEGRFQDPPTKDKKGNIEEGEWYHYELRNFSEKCSKQDNAESISSDPSASTTHSRWCRVYDFNPNSSQQLLQYMKSKNHPVPKTKEEDFEGNQKSTTAAKELQRLAVKTGDEFYLKVISYRGFTKLKGTYVEGFKPGADGHVHTTFTFDTAIGQLSSRNPNCQNFTKMKPTPKLAKAMRKMVAAKSGKIITEWDYKSCHALTLGYLAGSRNYMRMARLDIHSYVAGHFLGLWNAKEIIRESDDELRARFKWLKSDEERKRVRDDQAKHAILGIGNGLKYRGLYERYMEQFPTRACHACAASGKVPGLRGMKNCPQCNGSGKQSGISIAQEVLDICEALFSEVFAWQRDRQREAHDKQCLRSEFGHIRRFYEVFRWDHRKSAWGHGDQAEEAIAFWLANIAFAHIREALKELHRRGLAEKYGLFNNVHDSFMFHFDERLLEEHRQEVAPVLLAPSTILRDSRVAPGGLVVDVEAAWGKNWAEMQDLAVPRPQATLDAIAGVSVDASAAPDVATITQALEASHASA
jgi:uracil-DNA glycosylase family 4